MPEDTNPDFKNEVVEQVDADGDHPRTIKAAQQAASDAGKSAERTFFGPSVGFVG